MAEKNNTKLFLFLGAVAFFAFRSKGSAANNETPKNSPAMSSDTKNASIVFILKYWKLAQESQAVTGVPWIVTLAQAGLESAWGKSAYGNNFFGIKAGSKWTGATQELKTWECGNTGNPATDGIRDRVIQIFAPGEAGGNKNCNKYSYRVYGKFRAYGSPKDGFIDHGRFLQSNPRYAKAMQHTNDFRLFINEMAAAGYATAPNYAATLNKVCDNIQTILKTKVETNHGGSGGSW